jgi:hypothetical protein
MIEELVGNDPVERAKRSAETADTTLYVRATQDLDRELDADRASIENVRQLLLTTGVHGNIESEVKKLDGECEEMAESIRVRNRNFAVAATANTVTMIKLGAVVREAMLELQQQVAGLSESVVTLRGKGLEAAGRERIKVDQSYKRYSLASYVLYVLGWSLGLLGKIYGVPGVAGGE